MLIGWDFGCDKDVGPRIVVKTRSNVFVMETSFVYILTLTDQIHLTVSFVIYDSFTLYFQWSEWEKEKETVLFDISIRCIGIPYIIVGAYLQVLDLSISCGWHPYQPLSIHSHIILFSHKKTYPNKSYPNKSMCIFMHILHHIIKIAVDKL